MQKIVAKGEVIMWKRAKINKLKLPASTCKFYKKDTFCNSGDRKRLSQEFNKVL